MLKKIGAFLKAVFWLSITLLFALILLCLYPFWRLFVWFANKKLASNIRNTTEALETPVVFYEHESTGRKVVFLAMMHIGEAEYFASLQRLIDSLEGHTILYEGTGRVTEDQEWIMTPEECKLYEQFTRLFTFIQRFQEIMELKHQKEGLLYPPTWVNTDMCMYDIVCEFARQGVPAIPADEERRLQDFKEFLDKEAGMVTVRYMLNQLFSRFVVLGVIFTFFQRLSKKYRVFDSVILRQRNQVAFDGIMEHIEKSDVVTIWGAAHLSGIDTMLRAAGFREVRREWFQAYRIRDYSILDITEVLKRSINVSKKQGLDQAALEAEVSPDVVE